MKSIIYKATILLTLAIGAFTGCADREEPLTPTDTEGVVRVGLSTDSVMFGIDVATKAEPDLTPADFRIALENTKGELLRTWESYDQVPGVLRAVFGSYKMTATYGDMALLPAFDLPVYGAQSKFALSPAEPSATIQLNCKPLAAKVSVKFAPDFGNSYTSYSVAVKTTVDSLHYYPADQGREGYFVPGSLRLRFTLVYPKEPAKEYYYVCSAGVKAQAGHFYKLTIKSINAPDPEKAGDITLSIQTDNSLEQTITVPAELPNFWLPKPAPVVQSQPFGDNWKLTTTEGSVAQSANIILKTYAGAKSVVIKTTSAQLVEEGFPAEGIDIMRAAEAGYSEKIQMLKTIGITWSENLNDKTAALQLTALNPVLLDFRNLTGYLNTAPGVTTNNPFNVIFRDRYDQTTVAPLEFEVDVAPPAFKLETMNDANVWATQAFATVNYSLNRPGYKPYVEISADQGSAWIKQTQEVVSDVNGVIIFKITDLTPLTTYQFRVKLGKHTTESTNPITTEATLQVPNSDMETWQRERFDATFWGTGTKFSHYFPWASGDSNPWWDTGNDRSTSFRTAGIANNQYRHAAGTLYTDLAHTGKRAAEIRTVGAACNALVNSSSNNYDENRVRGRLLIGNYSYPGGQDDQIEYGKPFASRPLAVTFWYQYMPLNTDRFEVYVEAWSQNGAIKTTLGKGTLVVEKSVAMDIYEQATVPLVYENTKLRATHFTISFVSTNEATPRAATNVEITYTDDEDSGWRGHIGSRLRVDDIELTY